MGDSEYISLVGKSPDRFDPAEPLLLGREPGVKDSRCEGDMNVKRLREGVLGVVGGMEERVDDRGGVRGGSMRVARAVFADNSSPNISFLMRARYMLSASSSDLIVSKFLEENQSKPRKASISLALCRFRGF